MQPLNAPLSARSLFALLALFSFLSISSSLIASEDFPGCTDSTACNFQPGATSDDGSCLYGNCELLVVDDEYCFQEGEFPSNLDNVLFNDFILQGLPAGIQVLTADPCFYIDGEGYVRLITDATDCCGEHILEYMVCTPDGIFCSEIATVTITVKCGKPDCTLVNLADYITDDSAGGNPAEESCIPVCENSETTFFLPYDSNSTYVWTVVGGVGVTGANDAELIVTWGPNGPGSITVTITDVNGNEETILVCVDILLGPTASFTTTGYACLGQPMCFTDASLNADDYFWDFGNGFSSAMQNPCYTYPLPGNYTVTLTVTKYNFDAEGNPLCCCTDTYQLDVIVDDLPGPGIFWISTLCEGDSSCYWTDATNCSSYVWSVLDADGNVMPFTGQGNDTICVTWGAGPFGTIILDVDGCDSTYCENPTTVQVPIISKIGIIDGPTEVCEHATEVYCLPKWLSTTYVWTVTGGMILDNDSSHCATIMWGTAGVGTIHVDYFSDFLAGLPMHEGDDCTGSADLTVVIKPKFKVINYGPSVVCVGDNSTISVPGVVSPFFNWTVTPFVPITGNGSDQINIIWNTTPGVYVIEATPVDPTVYCNNISKVVVIVKDLAPANGIDGPLDICPGDTYYYSANSSSSGVSFNWTVTNGVLSSSTGATVSVTWGPVGPYTLTLVQQMNNAPYCLSPPVSITVNPKLIVGPLNVAGSAACTNSLSVYNLTPAQHPDANINWTVTTSNLGSVISGQGTATATVQWNDTPGPIVVTAQVSLCGDTAYFNLLDTIYSPIIPVITQVGYICPGGSATLDAGPGFLSYLWSTGSPIQTTAIFGANNYSVNTVDINNCPATTYFQANDTPPPPALISSGNNLTICLPNPHTVTIVAQTNPNLEFQWFCDGVSQGPFSTTSTFVHPNTASPASFSYHVVVRDIITMCQSTSLPIVVVQSECPPDPDPCQPQAYSVTIGAANQNPGCSTVDFSFTSSNFTFSNWTFGDTFGSGSPSPSHTYSVAGCYYVTLSGTVPAIPSGFCAVSVDTTVCVPIAADFDFDYLGCDLVKFNDMSTFIAGPGNAISSWFWNFGSGTSSSQNPTFSFPGPGSYPVTLTITNANGCQITASQTVIINSVGTPTISALPMPYCVGKAINFSAVAAGAVSYYWDFGDGSYFTGQSPAHTYTASGPMTVTVTATSNQGCTASSQLLINVNPAIPAGVITGQLVICSGATATLTAPAGYSYLWSNLMTTQVINVGPGTYSVILTDGAGCTLALDPVTVVALPAPVATISGPHYICDNNCITLTAPYSAGNSYQWYDNGGTLIPGAIFNTYTVCSGTISSPYIVEITDLNNCINQSAPFDVYQGFAPVFNILVAPDSCAGSPSTLTISPIDPNVTYYWSTGQTGTSIIVTQAGTYVATGVHNISGCVGSDDAVIHPLPDLCAVPSGCYEVCDPDTICGPAGLLAYQWHYNGAPLSGATSQCIEVSLSGSYALTGTNQFGCSLTSDSLYLEVVNCDSLPCDDLVIDWSYLTNDDGTLDSCCVSLSYTNNFGGPLQGIVIYTNDADLNVDLGSIDPLLQIQSIGVNNVSLSNIVGGNPLPAGVLNNFIEFCLENVTSNPQQIIIDWIDFENNVLCSDTINLECPVEPDCLYLTNDSIYCLDGLTFYDFTVCNPNDAPYSIGYIKLAPSSPVGVVLTPPDFDITGTPILPGTCQTFTVQLSGPGIANQQFCYQLLAHEFNPAVVSDALCCSVDTIYCITIPPCDPCGEVFVESVTPTDDENCCYIINLVNNYDPAYFDEIAICVLSPQTTFTVNNPFGSGWLTSGYTGTSTSFLPDASNGFFVPGGAFSLPEICVQTNVAPNQQIEVKWMKDGVVLCSDTVEVFCEPPCGYLLQESIVCNPNGTWNFSALIKNTANYTVSEAQIHFVDPALSAYDQTLSLGSLPPNGVFSSLVLNIGAPAMAGDTICFVITLHEIDAAGNYLSCCNFEYCVVLPDCGVIGCLCDEYFYDAVLVGLTCVASTSNPATITFSMVLSDTFQACDQFKWKFGDGTPVVITTGSGPVTHTFPATGAYTVCVKITRTADDGTLCSGQACKTVNTIVPGVPLVQIFPNPTNGLFKAYLNMEVEGPVKVTILDNMQRPIAQARIEEFYPTPRIEFNLEDKAPGLYLIQFDLGDRVVIEKIIVN
jgi:PKD repeat protein